MPSDEQQREHYDKIMAERRPTRGVFSCGYDTRFDPFLLDKRPDLVPEFEGIIRNAFPERVGRTLDIGCGPGLYFPLLAPRTERLVGIDISLEMIKAAGELCAAKGLSNVELRVASVLDLPFEDGSFDAVIGFDVLHHVPETDTAFAQIARVLRRGGRFVSIEPNVLNPMVFLTHLVPKEERGALWRNYPWRMRRMVRRYIGRPRVRYIWHVTAYGNKMLVAALRFCELTMSFWPLRCLGVRMIWSAEKR
jgi:SAM-dependent methyltransferase